MNLKFTDDLLTGVKSIDEQHKAIFRKMEGIIDASIEGRLKHERDELLNFLENYIDDHFKAEENLMSQISFRDYGYHKAQHDKFKVEIARIISEAKREPSNQMLTLDILKKTFDWFVNHICKEDKEVALLIKSTEKDSKR